MLVLMARAGRRLKRRLQLWAAATMVVTLAAVLLGCPGELEDPDRFKTDAAAGGGSSTSSTSAGTGGSTSSSSTSTTSGTAGGGGAGGG